LVYFLARRQRLAEALDLLDEAAPRCKPERVAQAGVAALRLSPAEGAHFRRVEARIEAARQADPRSGGLLLALADLRDAEGRYDEAITLYRRLLEDQPDNRAALNNLAWLLSLRLGKDAEALQLLEHARAVAGPAPGLLDTRGVVLARAGRPQEALRDLEDAVAQEPRGIGYFHLAQVHLALKDRNEARKAWKRSQELGIKPYQLHPLEREGYRKTEEGINGD
jgi:tetratricopeptide (TPR) repeat protein